MEIEMMRYIDDGHAADALASSHPTCDKNESSNLYIYNYYVLIN